MTKAQNYLIFLFFLIFTSVNAQFSFEPNYSLNVLNAPKTFNNKLQLSFVRSAEGFPNYGTLIAGATSGATQDGAAFQLYFPYSETLGGTAPKVRLGLYDNQGWSNWETFLTTANANKADVDWKAKKLIASDDITTEGRISLRYSSIATGDMISLYGTRLNADNMYGFGLESGALYSKSVNYHRWYLNKNADLGASAKMELNSTMLYVADKIGIGTKDTKGYALAVAGNIVTEEVKVALRTSWPDYVFKKAYDLPTLEEVEKHINEKGHLQNIPSEEEVLKNGINLGEMNAKLLQKIEEMTLYMIEEHKANEKLIKIIEEQNKRLEAVEKKQ